MNIFLMDYNRTIGELKQHSCYFVSTSNNNYNQTIGELKPYPGSSPLSRECIKTLDDCRTEVAEQLKISHLYKY